MKTSMIQKCGPWALVTGASDGIGRAFAEELARNGLNLMLVARRQALLSELARDLSKRHGIETRVVSADLSQADGVQAVIDASADLDIGLLIPAAGFGGSGNLADARIDDELSMIDVNCRSVLALTYHFADRFKQRAGGAIVLFSSIVAFQGTPRAANYAATKAYIQTLAEGIRIELQPYGIEVLSVAPGPVASGFADRANMQMGGTDRPEVVARGALAALGRATTSRPGLLGKVLGYSLSLTPRWGRVQIMRKVMGSMTAHQR